MRFDVQPRRNLSVALVHALDGVLDLLVALRQLGLVGVVNLLLDVILKLLAILGVVSRPQAVEERLVQPIHAPQKFALRSRVRISHDGERIRHLRRRRRVPLLVPDVLLPELKRSLVTIPDVDSQRPQHRLDRRPARLRNVQEHR